MRLSGVSGALVTVLTAACAEAPDHPQPSSATRDSAGVLVVESRESALGPDAWVLSESPVFQVGDAGESDEYWFGAVMGMTRLSDSTVVVADMQRSRLAFYHSNGRFIRAVGRQGEGPGEFGQIARLHRIGGDSLLVHDFGGFAQVFAADGTYARRISLVPTSSTSASGRGFNIIGSLGGGSFAASKSFVIAPGAVPDSAYIYRLGADGTVEDSILRYFTNIRMGDLGPVEELFSRRQPILAHLGKLYRGDPANYRIEVRDRNGRPERLVRRDWTPEPVTPADVELYRENFIGSSEEGGEPLSQRLRAQRERILAQSPVAERHPGFLQMLVDDLGNLWLQERSLAHQLPNWSGGFYPTVDSATRWSVFDSMGVWLTDVTMAPSFRVMEIGEDYVLGLARDELQVEQVRVYRLRKR